MKTYTFKDLIDSYRKNVQYENINYFQYYVEQYKAMSNAFGIFFDQEFEDYQKEDYRRWFLQSVRDYLKRLCPFSGLLEAPKHIITLYKKHSKDFSEIERNFHDTHNKFQIELFELMFGKIETEITSEDLINQGFDDTQLVPDPYDYY